MTGTLPKILNGTSGMIFVDADIDAVSRDRDFGRIEATVTLYVKQQGSPLRPYRVRTNVNDKGAAPLRARLIADATMLAEHFMSQTTSAGAVHAA
ncbi:hypothetical protein PARPLA_00479 [Rhodobacteraceae bacterium THAF1]|uniref:hypothetical protein n=1 Tax=Palleronia sp. THAF1 TaxID=2587842 RepID=UPI000F3C4EE1|nr:hypothetical protein [Palleronia sp. THAF1]QFU09958.1 hypothetical protein FIU81_14865 [Palleronia sp. THAF1]VDC17137.1 hypothetical protein PARPLA_00479 [Rhodobacteraceae bacterium THAF1]